MLRTHAPTTEPAGSPFVRVAKVHERLVHAIAVLPDGTCVSSGEDSRVLLWNLDSGAIDRELEGHEGPTNHLALTPDWRTLVSGGDDATVRLWDTKTWVARVLEGHTAYVRQVAATNAIAVSACEDGHLRVWDLATGECRHIFEHTGDVMSVTVTPDGARAITGTIDGGLHIWDLVSGEKIHAFGEGSPVMKLPGMGGLYIGGENTSGVGHKGVPLGMWTSPDGRRLLSVLNEVIEWDLARPRELRRGLPLGWPTKALAVHPDGWGAAGGDGVHIFRVEDFARIATLGIELPRVECLRLAPDGRRLLVGHEDGQVSVWQTPVDETWARGIAHPHSVSSVAIAADGSRAATQGVDGSIRIWSLPAGEFVAAIDDALKPNGGAMKWSADGELGIAHEKSLLVWGAAAPRKVEGPRGEGYFSLMDFTFVDGSAAALVGSGGEGLFRWDLAGGGSALDGRTQQITELQVSPDGKLAILSGYFSDEKPPADEPYKYMDSNSHLQGWDLEANRLLWSIADALRPGEKYGMGFGKPRFVGLDGGALAVFSGHGQRAGVCALRDARTGEVLRALEHGFEWVSAFRETADGRWLLATSIDEEPTLVELRRGGDLIRRRPLLGGEILFVDDTRLLLQSDTLLQLVAVETLEPLAQLPLGCKPRSAGLSPDGRTLVIGDTRGRVHFCDIIAV